MTKYASQQDYEAALADPNSFENRMNQSNSIALSVANPFNPFTEGLSGQGIMGGEPIRRYLDPILQLVKMKKQEELQNKIDPYVQEVQQLTDQTFPDLSLSGGGLRGGLGSIFGGGMGGPAVDFMTPNMGSPSGGNQLGGGLLNIPQSSQVSNTMQSLSNPFGTASFFR